MEAQQWRLIFWFYSSTVSHQTLLALLAVSHFHTTKAVMGRLFCSINYLLEICAAAPEVRAVPWTIPKEEQCTGVITNSRRGWISDNFSWPAVHLSSEQPQKLLLLYLPALWLNSRELITGVWGEGKRWLLKRKGQAGSFHLQNIYIYILHVSCDPLGHVKDRHKLTENEDLIAQSTLNDWHLWRESVFLRESKMYGNTRRVDMPLFMHVKKRLKK